MIVDPRLADQERVDDESGRAGSEPAIEPSGLVPQDDFDLNRLSCRSAVPPCGDATHARASDANFHE
jgi:hypothetical protein